MNKTIYLVVLATLLTTIAQLFYKAGALKLPVLFSNWEILFGFFLYCIAAVLIIWALRTSDVSVVFPILATSFVWVSILSVFWFGEILSVFNWAGVALISFGVGLIGWKK